MHLDRARVAIASRSPPVSRSWFSPQPWLERVLDRWLDRRDRLLASPRFQNWASAFAPTRPVARRRARALFDLCAGFVYSQILLACVRLGLLDLLREGPQTADEVARRLSLSTDAALRLLDAAASLRLVARRRGRRYGLGPLGAALCGNPGVVRMIEHHTLLYADLHDPVALLRCREPPPTALARFWPYAGGGDPTGLAGDEVGAYSALMAASQEVIAEDILDAYRMARHTCLLDVGGGEGVFAAKAAERAPALRVIVFDLPAVAERARARLAATGAGARVTAVGGDFLADPLPTGADVATLVRVVHDHDDDTALTILRRVRAALPAEGTLLVAEPMSGTAGAEPVSDAYFGFYLLAMGSGRPRTPDRLQALLGAAGFTHVRLVATRRPFLARLMVASAR